MGKVEKYKERLDEADEKKFADHIVVFAAFDLGISVEENREIIEYYREKGWGK